MNSTKQILFLFNQIHFDKLYNLFFIILSPSDLRPLALMCPPAVVEFTTHHCQREIIHLLPTLGNGECYGVC